MLLVLLAAVHAAGLAELTATYTGEKSLLQVGGGGRVPEHGHGS